MALWIAFLAGAVALKLVLLVLDPQPGFFLGDSASYLHSALTDWIPPDRSWQYGQLIVFIVGDTQSLTPLLIVQSLAGAATAVLAAWWAKLVFDPGKLTLALVVVLCALDPSQLLFERYVMTESFALLALAVQIVSATYLIVRGDFRWMPVVLASAVAVIALRMSLLPLVLMIAVAAPLLGWAVGRLGALATIVALAANAVLVPVVPAITWNIQTAPFLLAAWSPLLEARDFEDPALGERMLRDLDLKNRDLFAREVNLWHPTGLMHRLKTELPDVLSIEKTARAASLNVLKRDPIGVLRLGWRTYRSVWDTNTRLRLMQWDVGALPRDAGFRATLAKEFRYVADEFPRPTLTSRYYLGPGLWLSLFYLAAPLLLAASMLGLAREQVASVGLVCLASIVVLVTISVPTTLPVVRYLLPMSWFLAAVCIPAFAGLLLRAQKKRRPGLNVAGDPVRR